MPITQDYDSIQGMTLDQILFDTPEPFREKLLEQILKARKAVTLKATGPVSVRWKDWEMDFAEGEEQPFLPDVAIMLLSLYGREGIYFGMNQKTGLKPTSYHQLPVDERKRLGQITFITHYLTHAGTF